MMGCVTKYACIDAVELYITLAFDVEIVWRVLGHLPDWRLFFHSKRNVLDLFLALSSSIIQIPPIHRGRVYPWLTFFQLARFYRVIVAVPGMRPLLVIVFFIRLWSHRLTRFTVPTLWEPLRSHQYDSFFAADQFDWRFDRSAIIPRRRCSRTERDDLLPNLQRIPYHVSGMNDIVPGGPFYWWVQIFSSENWTLPAYYIAAAEVPFQQAAISLLFFSAWFLFANCKLSLISLVNCF